MNDNQIVTLSRDVEAAAVPFGTLVTLHKGEQAQITQSLGGSYTVAVNGNLFRLDGQQADALGLAPVDAPKAGDKPQSRDDLEKEVWNQMKACYDPEIPVNIVDLGLIYDCNLVSLGEDHSFRADVKMTLTAPGCGMGPVIQQDVINKLMSLEGIDETNVELVWEPPWNQDMMTEAARLQLGLY